jgi:hypothetical protein
MIQITDPTTGNLANVFVTNSTGYIDAYCRADTQATWEDAAIANGLATRQDDGTLLPSPGIWIDVIGSVVKTDAVLAEDGTEITPAVMDDRYHVNFRLDPSVSWEALAIAWTANGTLDSNPDATEVARKMTGVALIDPDSIHSNTRMWA